MVSFISYNYIISTNAVNYTNKQFHFKQFSVTKVHSLILNNISILSYSV